MTTNPPATSRTYGGWRRGSTPGIGSLGFLGTAIFMAGSIVTIIAVAIGGILAGIPFVILTVGATVPLVIRTPDGRNLAQWITARTAWGRGKLAGNHLYQSGLLARTGHGTCSLPGLGASIEALEAQDAYGRRFALLSHPHAEHVSVTLSTNPDGSSLVDESQIDSWVAHFAGFLAQLSHEPSLVAASVTIEAAPEPGHRLATEVRGQMAPTAPPLARQVLDEVVASYPSGSAQMTSRVALTWSTAPRPGQKRRSLAEMAIDIGHRLPALTHALGATGAGPARPMTVHELSAAVRVAFDPAVHELVDSVDPETLALPWSDCGPAGAQEAFDAYRHDSGLSVSWHMVEPPRGQVFASILSRLVSPDPAVPRKRVTLVYRPFAPAQATKVVERGRRDAIFAAEGRKVGRARDVADVRAAEAAADEEARGAGVLRFGLLVTATVLDPEQLAAATNAVEDLATTSRIRLRRAYGSQGSTFLAALPLGMVLPVHLRVPSFIREAM
jgi:hypothetical protein